MLELIYYGNAAFVRRKLRIGTTKKKIDKMAYEFRVKLKTFPATKESVRKVKQKASIFFKNNSRKFAGRWIFSRIYCPMFAPFRYGNAALVRRKLGLTLMYDTLSRIVRRRLIVATPFLNKFFY